MKRYRLALLDFDARASSLSLKIEEAWDEKVKEQHKKNKENIIKGLIDFFGEVQSETKIKNFIDLGNKPLSILAFHNKFFEHVRVAFVMGAYYPALTGACALGERMLNHLLLTFLDDYKGTSEYKKVYKKKQIVNWDLLIKVLSAWKILLPDVSSKFKELKRIRHRAIHFRPEIDHNDRELALEAISTLQEIIQGQFASWGKHPWFFSIPGEIFIKKEWEEKPFIKKIYLANAALVGPYHKVESITNQWVFSDDYKYDEKGITDEEYSELRKKFNKNGQKIG